MFNYLYNNLYLVEKYQSLYENGVDINGILKKYDSGMLFDNEIEELSRFQIFLDSCILLLNKEKLEKDLKRKFSFEEYLKQANINSDMQNIKDIVNETIIYDKHVEGLILKEVSLFYSLDGKKYSPWKQGKIIRDSLAHAQFSTFVTNERGMINYFYVDNIDETKNINGIVVEAFFHDWIMHFFSNYSTIGIPYKHTCISYFSFKQEEMKNQCMWITFKISDAYIDNYPINKLHPMKELGTYFKTPSLLLDYVCKNKKMFDIEEIPLSEMLNNSQINALKKKYSLIDYDAVVYGIKTILDPETELSNFLVHLSILNDTIKQTEYFDKYGTIQEKTKNRSLMKSRLNELFEDKNARLAFRLGFLLLKAFILAFRFEKKEYIDINYPEVDVSEFLFAESDVDEFCRKEQIKYNKKEHYVITKLRNALMHGNIKFELDINGDVIYVFNDTYYKKRVNTIKISELSFKKFLSQKSLYNGISAHGISLNFLKRNDD